MGLSAYTQAKAIPSRDNVDKAIRSPRAWHADIANARNLGDPDGVNMKLNCEIKKDNFEKSIILRQEVRSIHSSEEVG